MFLFVRTRARAMGGHGSTKYDDDAHSPLLGAPPPLSLHPDDDDHDDPELYPQNADLTLALLSSPLLEEGGGGEAEWQTTREVIVKVQVTRRTFLFFLAAQFF